MISDLVACKETRRRQSEPVKITEWKNEYWNGWMYEWMSAINGYYDEWMNESMNEWNEQSEPVKRTK